MRKALALTAFLALAPYANAQDAAAKADVSVNAEFRARYQYDNNINASKDLGAESQSNVNQRMKLGAQFKASDKLSAHITALHASTWGSDNATGLENGTTQNVKDHQNLLTVYEMYATWMMSDEFSLKAGRGAFTMADGSLISANDWEQNPISFEGVLGSYEMEFGRANLFFVRFAELAGVGTPTADDPEANSFGLSFDFKNLPEFLSTANVHVLQTKKDESGAGAGEDQLRYGLVLAGNAAIVDYKGNFEAHTGKLGGADREGMMYQLELGANFEEFMKSRVYALYHSDSGTSGTKNETYDSFYYEEHANAGLMDVVGWGNLTQISVGFTMEPMDATTVGLHYHMFEKTEEGDAVNAGKNGGMFSVAGQTLKPTGTKIGDELDLVATHNYDNGFSMTGRLGMFMPGEVLKDATPTSQKDTYMTAFLEGKMTF